MRRVAGPAVLLFSLPFHYRLESPVGPFVATTRARGLVLPLTRDSVIKTGVHSHSRAEAAPQSRVYSDTAGNAAS